MARAATTLRCRQNRRTAGGQGCGAGGPPVDEDQDGPADREGRPEEGVRENGVNEVDREGEEREGHQRAGREHQPIAVAQAGGQARQRVHIPLTPSGGIRGS